MPRFAVLRHELPPESLRPSHFDLLLEDGDALRTFALAAFPADGGPCDAEPLPPHRVAYLTYEGPVSGGRGRVTRVAAGTYDIVSESTQSLALRLQTEDGTQELELHWKA